MKNNTRKVLALVLALALCMTVGAGALAEDIEITNNSEEKTVKTSVTYTVEGGYTVVIPASVTIETGKTETTMDITIKQGSLFDDYLCVYLQGSANDFKLMRAKDDPSPIGYSMSRATGSRETIEAGGRICRNSATQLTSSDLVHRLALKVTEKATAAGTYTDTLTFEVKLEKASTEVTD